MLRDPLAGKEGARAATLTLVAGFRANRPDPRASLSSLAQGEWAMEGVGEREKEREQRGRKWEKGKGREREGKGREGRKGEGGKKERERERD